MNNDSSGCKLCGYPTHNADGTPIGIVHVYQRIEGKLRLAEDLVLGKPMYFIHEVCPGDE